MTLLEKNQPPSVFSHAGKMGYMIGVHIRDNPYSQEPYRSLWEKGWRDAQRRAAQTRLKWRRRAAAVQEDMVYSEL